MQNVNVKNIISLIIASFSIGWIIGNSVTPVISTVINSIMTIIATILTVSVGLELKENNKLSDIKINLLPFAIFCFFLAGGGSLGVYSRENNWLGHKTMKKNELTEPSKFENRLPNEQDDIGFKNDESSFCSEISSNYSSPKVLKILLKEKSKKDKTINLKFLNNLSDSLTIVSYAKSICEK